MGSLRNDSRRPVPRTPRVLGSPQARQSQHGAGRPLSEPPQIAASTLGFLGSQSPLANSAPSYLPSAPPRAHLDTQMDTDRHTHRHTFMRVRHNYTLGCVQTVR